MRCPSCGNENREGARFCDSCGADLAASQTEPDAPASAAEVLPSDVPAELAEGRYRVRSFLGQGGRKRVYLADDTASGREVAVALFDTEGVAAAVQARATREAQAMRKLGDHPHVVSVLDTGEEDGNPFIVSEYMPGGDVESLLAAEGGSLEAERAAGIAADVTRALEHAHARGIVHRDLKPANVWLDDDGAARLGDFGLATTEGRSRVSGGNLVGTVAYLPPEQALGDTSGPESDLYSLGALLYEMLTGQPPVRGRRRGLDHLPAPARRPGAALAPQPRRPAGARPGDAGAAGQAAARTAPTAPRPCASRSRPRCPRNPPPRKAASEPTTRSTGSPAASSSGASASSSSCARRPTRRSPGSGGLLLLVGEPGIGKTRTVGGARHLRAGQRRPGLLGPLPRGRGRARLLALGAGDPRLRARRRPRGDGLADGRRGRRDRPARARGGGAPRHRAGRPSESEEARFRLFDSVASFLVAAARDRPMVLVLDDLHWADEPSLLLLKFVAGEIGSAGLLIVGTYRDVELGRHHPLARVLGELGGTRIALGGFTPEAIERYVEMTAGAKPPPGLAEAVHAQTDGNPFFVGEVVRLLASEGRLTDPDSWQGQIPQGVREVVGRRLDRLSEQTNEGLKVAAVIGREFDVDVLVKVKGVTDAEEHDGRRAARRSASGWSPTPAAGASRFAHALVRDTLYEEVSPPQRAELHQKTALALEELYGDDPGRLGELAHHFLAGASRGDAGKAIDYAERAGEQAMDQLAYEEAAELYERALEVLELQDEPDERAPPEPGRWRWAAPRRARRRSRDARRAFGRAAESARALGDADGLVGAAIGIAMLSEAGRPTSAWSALIDEALEAIGPEPSAARASLLSAKSQELYWVDAQGLSAPLVEEAIEIARQVDAPADPGRGAAPPDLPRRSAPAPPSERIAIADEMIELGALVRRPRGRAARPRLPAAELPRARRHRRGRPRAGGLRAAGRRAADAASTSGRPTPCAGMRAMIDGDLEEAERSPSSRAARASAPSSRSPSSTTGSSCSRSAASRGAPASCCPRGAGAGRALPGHPRLAQRADHPRRPDGRGRAGPGRARALRRRRLLGGAPRRQLAAGDRACWPRRRRCSATASAPSCSTTSCCPTRACVIVVARAAGFNGPVDRVLGLLAQTCGRLDQAVEHLESAIDLATRMGDRPGVAISRVGPGRGAAGPRRARRPRAGARAGRRGDRPRPRDGRPLDRRAGPGPAARGPGPGRAWT